MPLVKRAICTIFMYPQDPSPGPTISRQRSPLLFGKRVTARQRTSQHRSSHFFVIGYFALTPMANVHLRALQEGVPPPSQLKSRMGSPLRTSLAS